MNQEQFMSLAKHMLQDSKTMDTTLEGIYNLIYSTGEDSSLKDYWDKQVNTHKVFRANIDIGTTVFNITYTFHETEIVLLTWNGLSAELLSNSFKDRAVREIRKLLDSPFDLDDTYFTDMYDQLLKQYEEKERLNNAAY